MGVYPLTPRQTAIASRRVQQMVADTFDMIRESQRTCTHAETYTVRHDDTADEYNDAAIEGDTVRYCANPHCRKLIEVVR